MLNTINGKGLSKSKEVDILNIPERTGRETGIIDCTCRYERRN